MKSLKGKELSFDAAVIGAGFAGMYMLHALRQIGLSAIVFEAGSDVGGTWHWNRYPGARCDTESMFYSYSWPKEIRQNWEWSSRNPDQEEILFYIRNIVEKFDLKQDTRPQALLSRPGPHLA